MGRYDYDFKGDILSYCEAKGIGLDEFCAFAGISRPALNEALKSNRGPEVLEKSYTAIYRSGFLLNKAKDELFHDEYGQDAHLLYHGSKFGLGEITLDKARANCDFGPGFYMSLSLASASSFAYSFKESSTYLFKLNMDGCKVMTLDTNESWMLLVAHYRGFLEEYKDSPKLRHLIEEAEEQDVLIAPIADNKMFQILDDFANHLLTLDQAAFCLSVSRLGSQYVFRTKKAIESLTFLNRYYYTYDEREAYRKEGENHASLIDSKLYLAKRKYRNKGKYIDELL